MEAAVASRELIKERIINNNNARGESMARSREYGNVNLKGV